ncbi:hypothetical protein F4802DRAFT_596639 [Xylaria palmicola]|nr:hypothetical protein F4802DRAFT_596639 [Xylaria palmicola]
MANVRLTNAKLLSSGEYSDLTIMCEGQEFHVHKAIVCTQSPIIAAAMKSNFKEAKTNTIEVNFDLITLKCMLDYLYKGDYEEKPTGFAKPLSSTSTLPGPASITPQQGSKEPPDTSINDILLYHAYVNFIADYYAVGGLSQMTLTKLKKVLDENWSGKVFYEFLKQTKDRIGDNNLRQLLVDMAASHIVELMKDSSLVPGAVGNDMAAEILAATMVFIKNTQARLTKKNAELNAELNAEKAKSNALFENLEELVSVSWSTRSCCKRDCTQIFGCAIQSPRHNPEKRYFVRCSSCGCRHKYDKAANAAILAPPPFRG